jgi:hypothetical protein
MRLSRKPPSCFALFPSLGNSLNTYGPCHAQHCLCCGDKHSSALWGSGTKVHARLVIIVDQRPCKATCTSMEESTWQMAIDPLAFAAETCARLCMVSSGWVRNITFFILSTSIAQLALLELGYWQAYCGGPDRRPDGKRSVMCMRSPIKLQNVASPCPSSCT